MKLCVFIFFMVTQVILCDKDTSKLRRKLIVPKISDKCKKIKCAPTEEPECVKLWRPDLKHTFYINVINKCELEYMKCHDGVEAKIVPMKFCGHGNGMSKANNKKNKTSQAHVRAKRNAKRKTTTDTALASPSLISNENKTVLSASNTKKDHHKWKHEDLNLIYKDKDLDTRMKKKGGKSVRLQSDLGYPYSTEEVGSDTEVNERKKIGKGLAGHPLSVETDYEVPLKVVPSAPEFLEGKNAATGLSKTKINKIKYPPMSGKNPWWTKPEIASKETLQNKKFGLADADIKEQDELCPAVCASRDVMVCARCQHGIYKTFISICHMRLFSCNHNDEVLELISRYPCVLSAPYLSEQDMVPKGRIIEATDDDKVLRFIICRDKNQLGSGVEPADPRCALEKNPMRRGIGIRLPSSSEDTSSSITLGSSSSSSSWSKSSDNSSSIMSTSSGATSTGLSSSGLTSDSSKC